MTLPNLIPPERVRDLVRDMRSASLYEIRGTESYINDKLIPEIAATALEWAAKRIEDRKWTQPGREAEWTRHIALELYKMAKEITDAK